MLFFLRCFEKVVLDLKNWEKCAKIGKNALK